MFMFYCKLDLTNIPPMAKVMENAETSNTFTSEVRFCVYKHFFNEAEMSDTHGKNFLLLFFGKCTSSPP